MKCYHNSENITVDEELNLSVPIFL